MLKSVKIYGRHGLSNEQTRSSNTVTRTANFIKLIVAVDFIQCSK